MRGLTGKVQYHYINEVLAIKSKSNVSDLFKHPAAGIFYEMDGAREVQLIIFLERSTKQERKELLHECQEFYRTFLKSNILMPNEETRRIVRYYSSSRILKVLRTKPVVPLYE